MLLYDHQNMNLATEEDIEAEFNRLSVEEEDVEKELDSLLSHYSHIDAKIANISKALPNLEMVHHDSKRLSEMIIHTSQLAENISAKVRKLDTARSRVWECQRRVHDLLDVELCSSGVDSSLQAEDFEKAAVHIHRYLAMDRTLLEKTADDIHQDCTSVSNSLAFLQNAADKLSKVISEKFQKSIDEDDAASVERFFKLFPLIGMHKEPLVTYSRYLTKKVDSGAKKLLQTALTVSPSDKRAAVAFSDAVTSLFEQTAKIIQVQQPLIEINYGEEGMLDIVVKELETAVARQVSVMLSEMTRVRGLDKLRQHVSRPPKGSAPIDPRDLDPLLNEMAHIQSRYHLFNNFVSSKTTYSRPEGTKRGALCNDMHALLSTYLVLEQHYMQESVRKAISMDSIEPSDFVSTMVDDVFFIVKKSIRRASQTGLDGACAVINQSCAVLETELCGALERSMRQGFPSGYLDLAQAYNAMIQGKVSTEQSSDNQKATFIKHLNNTEVCSEYIGTLAESLSTETRVANEGESAKLQGCLTGLSRVSAQLAAVRDIGFQQLRIAHLRPRLAPTIDFFTTLSHHLTEEEFSSYEANEPFTRSLISHLDTLLSDFKETVTQHNYETIVSIVATEVAALLEKVIMKTQFNRLGGLALDKEVRSVVSYLAGATSWSVRDKLARLSQIATILNLETVSEMADYWHQTSLTWRLTHTDIKNILKLRADFQPDDIVRLKL